MRDARLDNVKVCKKHEVEFCGDRPCDICRLSSQETWHKVSEKLPEMGKIVRVVCYVSGHPWMSYALRYREGEGFDWEWSFITDDHIRMDWPERYAESRLDDWKPVYWQPLPPSPTEEPK